MLKRRTQTVLILLPLITAALVLSAQQPAPRPDVPFNDTQMRAIVLRAIAMQHRSDAALDLYDRTERIVDREQDKTTDTTFRTVPVGASHVRVDMIRDGHPVPPAEISQQWQYILGVMEQRTHLGDPDVKKEYEKVAARKENYAKMVDAITDAFLFHWSGRTTRAGRSVIELNYEPNPSFKSSLRLAGLYWQVYGKVWVDEASGYVVRLEAELRQDIPVGGGIVGKIYKGARVELDQAEPNPGAGVWLPTQSVFDIEGRKFVFPASMHRKFYAADYRRIGPPAEALVLLRDGRAQQFPSGQ
jgi:hypothetical protein